MSRLFQGKSSFQRFLFTLVPVKWPSQDSFQFCFKFTHCFTDPPPFLGCWDTQQQSLLGVRQTSNLGLLAPVESIPFRVPRCIIFIFLTNLQICQFPSVNVLLQLLFYQIQSSVRVRFEVIRPLGCSGVWVCRARLLCLVDRIQQAGLDHWIWCSHHPDWKISVHHLHTRETKHPFQVRLHMKRYTGGKTKRVPPVCDINTWWAFGWHLDIQTTQQFFMKPCTALEKTYLSPAYNILIMEVKTCGQSNWKLYRQHWHSLDKTKMPQKDLLAVCTIGRLNNRRESGTIKRFTYPETFHAFLDQDKNQIVF